MVDHLEGMKPVMGANSYLLTVPLLLRPCVEYQCLGSEALSIKYQMIKGRPVKAFSFVGFICRRVKAFLFSSGRHPL